MKKFFILLTISFIYLSMFINAQQLNYTAEYPNYSIDIRKVGSNSPTSIGGLHTYDGINAVIYEIGKIASSTYGHGVYQWNINDLEIPNNSTIDSVTVSFEYTKVDVENTTLNYFNCNTNITDPNLDLTTLWNSTDKIQVTPIGSGDYSLQGNRLFVKTTFKNGSIFVTQFANSINQNDRFTLGIAWKYESPEAGVAYWRFVAGGLYPSISVFYTPPSQTVTLDQRNSLNQQVGVLKKWEGSNWSNNFNPDTSFNFLVNSEQTILGDQTVISNQKYHRWLRNSVNDSNNINFHSFTIKPFDNNFTSRFEQTQPGITIKNSLEYSSVNGGNIQFKDPWLIDYPDPLYGNTLRNQGMSAPFKQRTSPFYPNFTTGYNGDVYKGVFLNQIPDPNDPNKPYYSVKMDAVQDIYLTQTGKTHKFYFQNWGGTNVNYQYANALETPVVFTLDGATVQANLKGTQLSNNVNAYINNSQRKFLRTSDGTLHNVYESQNRIWYEISTDNGSTWSLMNNGKPLSDVNSKLPSIDYYGLEVAIVFQQQSGSNYTIELKTFYSFGNKYVAGISSTIFTEPVDEYSVSANPNIAWGNNSKFIILWERKDNTGFHLPFGLNYKYGSLGYNTITMYGTGYILGTDANSVNATVYSNQSDYTGAFQIAYQQNSWTKYIYYCRLNISPTWEVTKTAVADLSAGNGYFSNYQPSIVTMEDGSARVCWLGDYSGNGTTVNVIYRNPANSTFYSFGYNARSTSINISDDNSCFVTWSTNFGGSAWINGFVDVSNPYNMKTLNTTGKDVQLSNGINKSNMFVSSFYPFASPYFFKTSNNLGSLTKTEANSVSSGQSIVVVKDDAQFSCTIGDILVNSEKIKFINTSNHKNTKEIKYKIFTEPFTIKSNSDVRFSLMTGVLDSAAALLVLGDKANLQYSVVLIDNETGNVLGKLAEMGIDRNNIPNGQILSFSLNTTGLEDKTVKVELTLETDIKQPEIYYVERYLSNGAVLGKSSGDIKEISLDGNEIPKEYALAQNFPNPFNPTTKISWQSPVGSHQTLKVYDILGNEVATLVDEYREAGRYEINFDASNLASGVYIYRITIHPDKIQAGDFVSSKKMILLK